MRKNFFNLAFTPAVKALQTRRGSRKAYARAEEAVAAEPEGGLGPEETAFIGTRDSFYLASVSETGWPYVQHRGGPKGFVRVLDDRTIGWAEYRGNRQYVTAGNVSADDRVSLFFMDYPNQRRLKLLGRLTMVDAAERPDLAAQLDPGKGGGVVEALVTVRVEASDWNCPQHITPRYTIEEITEATQAAESPAR
jgi:uncharacterized protein